MLNDLVTDTLKNEVDQYDKVLVHAVGELLLDRISLF